jgi:hypothetical protein
MGDEEIEWRRTVNEAIWGHNGNRGLVVDVTALCGKMDTFIATVKTREEERKTAAERSDKKVNWLIGILTFTAIALGSLAAVLALNHPARAQSVLQNLSHSNVEYSQLQDAHIPYLPPER